MSFVFLGPTFKALSSILFFGLLEGVPGVLPFALGFNVARGTTNSTGSIYPT